MLSWSVLRGFYTSFHSPAQAPLQPIARGCSRSRTCAMRPFCAPALRGTLNKLEVEVGQDPACLGNLETGLAGGGGRLYLKMGDCEVLGGYSGRNGGWGIGVGGGALRQIITDLSHQNLFSRQYMAPRLGDDPRKTAQLRDVVTLARPPQVMPPRRFTVGAFRTLRSESKSNSRAFHGWMQIIERLGACGH